jgi:transposase
MKVIIGVDPHKASHTAVAIDPVEDELSRLHVRSSRRQVEQLLVWAASFEKRTWAIESAGGMGYLLAQQLVAAGEEVGRAGRGRRPRRRRRTRRCRPEWATGG